MRVTKITKDSRYPIYTMRCPKCGKVLASASEIEIMPEWAFCNCDVVPMLDDTVTVRYQIDYLNGDLEMATLFTYDSQGRPTGDPVKVAGPMPRSEMDSWIAVAKNEWLDLHGITDVETVAGPIPEEYLTPYTK